MRAQVQLGLFADESNAKSRDSARSEFKFVIISTSLSSNIPRLFHFFQAHQPALIARQLSLKVLAPAHISSNPTRLPNPSSSFGATRARDATQNAAHLTSRRARSPAVMGTPPFRSAAEHSQKRCSRLPLLQNVRWKRRIALELGYVKTRHYCLFFNQLQVICCK